VRGGITWLRPWLDTPRSEIEDYVRRHRLEHIDDDTNDDARFARNRLRLKVWPALTQAFPEAETTLADSATWAQEADACLDELAQLDLQRIADTTGWRVADAAGLSAPRRSNALRHWLRQQLGRPAESSLLTRMLDELRAPGPHRWTTKEGELRHYRGRLKFESRHLGAASTGGREQQLRIQRAGRYRLPGWGGELRVRRVPQGGVPLAWLAHVCVLARGGGERYQAGPGRPPRSLKKQFQARGVPAWARDAPLFFSGGQLVFVPGLGIDARAIGLPGQAQVSLEWLPTAHTG
jgi:tRNA(Ile)-lysidine synthase